MKKVEYNIQLQSVFNLAALTRRLRLRDLLEAIEQADTVGPILNPTLYTRAVGPLTWQKELVQAALAFQAAIEKIVDKYGEADHVEE